jgi:acetyl esterase
VQELTIPVADRTLPARLFRNSDQALGLIVYFHGGGWLLGDIDTTTAVADALARETGCAVLLVGYRLAPESPYPAAVEDALATTAWARDNAARLLGAARPEPIIVAGDSAGGNLAAVVAQSGLRADIALQVLVYPVTDCDFDTESYVDPGNELLTTRDTMMWFWHHYLPDRQARTDPAASPLRAPDLSGLPPAVVLVAEHDVLRDEGESYAWRLARSGVPVSCWRVPGQIHGFLSHVGILPGSALGLRWVGAHVRAALTANTTSE